MRRNTVLALITALAAAHADRTWAQTYRIVDTGQTIYYGNEGSVAPQNPGDAFFGQDAQHAGNQPSYTLGGNGAVVVDNVTGLSWTQSIDWDGTAGIDINDKMTRAQIDAYVVQLNANAYGGRTDWRVPTVKQLYSLVQFDGIQPPPNASTAGNGQLYIDSVFDFSWGDTANNDRIIDMQVWSNTTYTSTTMNGDNSFLSANFADGRIKAYPLQDPPTGNDKAYYAMFVAGNTAYGVNDFQDNTDGTITDSATHLMWTKNDSGQRMDWEAALAYARTKNTENYLGYSDWRLPNAKELQSLVDYNRSPDATGTPAINPLFNLTTTEQTAGAVDDGDRTDTDYGFHWSSTTFLELLPDGSVKSDAAVYISFFEALGLGLPNATSLLDVHGAGAQRSDPKEVGTHSAGDFFGPQEDYLSIENYVLLVRDVPEPSSLALLGVGGLALLRRPRGRGQG